MLTDDMALTPRLTIEFEARHRAAVHLTVDQADVPGVGAVRGLDAVESDGLATTARPILA
jgi:hypothetical protein